MRVELSFRHRVGELSRENLHRCYWCQKCTAGCPTAFAMDCRPAQLLRMVQLGRKEALLGSPSLWRCTGCNQCGVRCPYGINLGEVVEALRQVAVEGQYLRPDLLDDEARRGLENLARLAKTISLSRNISGDENSSRLMWSQNLARMPPGLRGEKKAKTLYFAGCVSSFYPRSFSIPQAFVQALEAAGEDFTTLGGEEWCCGYPLMAAGRPGQAQELASHNLAQVREMGTQRVVTTCPSCYYAWKHLYQELWGDGLGIQVLHSSELLLELVEGGRLKLGKVGQRATYHDPCDLGRKGKMYEAPREVLKGIPGLELVEMAASRQDALCCGGGGNLESFDPELVAQVAARRLSQAFETRAKLLISACPQCERTFGSAMRRARLGREERMEVMDITELVWRAVEEGRLC